MGAGAKWTREQYVRAVTAADDKAKNYPADFVQALGQNIHEAEQLHPEWIAGDEGGGESGDGATNEPTPTTSQPNQQPQPPTPPSQPSVMDAIGQYARRGLDYANTAADQLLQGAGTSLAQKTGAGIATMLPSGDTTGIPRTYAAGSEMADISNTLRTESGEALARNPSAGAFRVAGMAPLAIASGGTSLPAQLAATGFAEGVGSSPSADLGEQAKAGVVGAGTSALMGGLVQAPLALARGVGASSAPILERAAQWMRGHAVTGAIDPLERETIVRAFGDRFPAGTSPARMVGTEAERLGLPRASRGPMTSTDYGEAAGETAKRIGDETLGPILDRNSAAGVQMSREDLLNSLIGDRANIAGRPGEMNTAAARTYARAINDIGQKSPEQLTVRDLQDLKNTYNKQGGRQPGVMQTPMTPAKKEAARGIAGTIGNHLKDTMGELAFREDVPAFNRAYEDIGSARTIQSVSEDKAGTSLQNSVARAVHGPVSALVHGGIEYGADTGAMALHGMQHGAESVARGAGQLMSGPLAGVAGRLAAEASSGRPTDMEARVKAHPELLGNYADAFQRAEQGPPHATGALIYALSQSDPRFREVLRSLGAQTQ